MKTYSTQQAAKLMGIGFRTLGRWLADGRIKSSTAVKMPNGRTFWLWNRDDIEKGRKIKATLKTGPKPKGEK